MKGVTLNVSLRDLISIKLVENWHICRLVYTLTVYQRWNLRNNFMRQNSIFENDNLFYLKGLWRRYFKAVFKGLNIDGMKLKLATL